MPNTAARSHTAYRTLERVVQLPRVRIPQFARLVKRPCDDFVTVRVVECNCIHLHVDTGTTRTQCAKTRASGARRASHPRLCRALPHTPACSSSTSRASSTLGSAGVVRFAACHWPLAPEQATAYHVLVAFKRKDVLPCVCVPDLSGHSANTHMSKMGGEQSQYRA